MITCYAIVVGKSAILIKLCLPFEEASPNLPLREFDLILLKSY